MPNSPPSRALHHALPPSREARRRTSVAWRLVGEASAEGHFQGLQRRSAETPFWELDVGRWELTWNASIGTVYHSLDMKGYVNPHLLVSARELAGIVAGPESARPLILDLRPPEAYTEGHVPGAVHLDLWGVSLIDTDPAPLNAFMWMIEHVLAGHGVDRGRPVVVYDEHSGMRAARAFWFLEYFGHPNVRVLDGGYGSWTREGFPVTREAGPPPKSEWTGSASLTPSRPGEM